MNGSIRLADILIDHLGWLGYHLEVYRSRDDREWCELVAVDLATHERWTVSGSGLYASACFLAEKLGIELDHG